MQKVTMYLSLAIYTKLSDGLLHATKRTQEYILIMKQRLILKTIIALPL